MFSNTSSMINARSNRVLAIGFLAVALTAAGCSDDDESPVAPVPGQTSLRAIHLSPDAPEVDIYFNGGAAPSVTDLAFNEGTNYLKVAAGKYDVAIAPANTTVGDAVLSVNDVDLKANTNYTAVAFDQVASIDALLLVDNLQTPAAGQIQPRSTIASSITTPRLPAEIMPTAR